MEQVLYLQEVQAKTDGIQVITEYRQQILTELKSTISKTTQTLQLIKLDFHEQAEPQVEQMLWLVYGEALAQLLQLLMAYQVLVHI